MTYKYNADKQRANFEKQLRDPRVKRLYDYLDTTGKLLKLAEIERRLGMAPITLRRFAQGKHRLPEKWVIPTIDFINNEIIGQRKLKL